MTNITLQDGAIVLHDGKVGTEQACCCGCNCIDVCQNTSIRATYQGETLAIGGSKQNGGNLLTEGRETWSFDCDTFETIDESGTPYTFDGLIFAYEKILVDCEEEWSEYFFLSCSNGQWTADIYRRYIDREVIFGSACNDEFAPPCEQYWFNVPVSVGSDCLPVGDVAASGDPDIEEDNGGTACGGGTFGTLTLSYV